MNFPEHLLYTAEHEWVDISDGIATMGITDYAQDALGDVVFVGLPELGRTVGAGDSIAEVESTKSVSDIFAPVAGVISEINERLQATPELLNSDPYGEGWICRLTLAGDPAGQLLDIAAYRKLLNSE
ncbi:MAG: glycine cleavage system protein GcvH [Ferrimicrobium sp.]|jgi:glycine cleavage system H protein|uniref:Glycine cleavage system H protein n=2 Tax=Ferrimicrobium acidiphilum TaxID=121039 RepID=A0ABV3Y3Y0_9ACTN|nr:glycine cleavage system protein GcvH [Ferrimicrobium sp.]